MRKTSCCSTEPKGNPARPGPVGTAARLLVGLVLLGGAWLALRAGGFWLAASGALGAFGMLIELAAFVRQPGCEVNLIWTRLLGKAPINCFLFGSIDRWEQSKK